MSRSAPVHAHRLFIDQLGKGHPRLYLQLELPSEGVRAVWIMTPAEAAHLASQLLAWSGLHSETVTAGVPS